MKQMQYSLKENIWVKKDAIVEEQLDEEAPMEGDGAQGDEEAMHEDEEPPTVPLMAPSSSHANEDTSNKCLGIWTPWQLAWKTSQIWILIGFRLMMLILLPWLKPWKTSMSV
uniref:Uncharacterized protein n=1 Tax=Fagus sylvatica TaxID=28930 RepID=A0A2N9HV69_FAGSY